MSEVEKAHVWKKLARRARRKFNVGWWLNRFLPMLVAAALLGAVALVVLRTYRVEPDALWVAGVGAGVVALLAVVAWMLARAHFIDEAKALVRLESNMNLRNALTTAAAGVGPWPVPPDHERRAAANGGLRWRWSALLVPLFAAVLVVAAGLLIPVEGFAKKAELPAAEPLAWEQMDNWLDIIAEQEVVDPEAIEAYREDVRELRNQPQEDWFSHSSMEAGDSLRESLGREVQKLGAEMSQAERDLNVLENFGDQISQEKRGELIEEFQSAVKGLSLGKLPLNAELMETLKGLNPSQMKDALSQLSPEQLQQLREQLKKGAQACKECQGNGQGLPGMSDSEMLLGILREGREGDGYLEGEGPGKGGVSRGRGDAPMFYGDEQDIDGGKIEGVTNTDLSRAAPGDVIGEGEVDHDDSKLPMKSQEAGAVSGTGKGGDAVWRESLMPDEKAVLKKYFK